MVILKGLLSGNHEEYQIYNERYGDLAYKQLSKRQAEAESQTMESMMYFINLNRKKVA